MTRCMTKTNEGTENAGMNGKMQHLKMHDQMTGGGKCMTKIRKRKPEYQRRADVYVT